MRTKSTIECVGLIAAIVFGVALAPTAVAGDIGKAQLLYQNQLLDDAKRELVDIITTSSSTADRARAMHLLGTIAVDEKRYESALQTWNDLVKQFPDSPDANEVAGKIPLVRTIAESSAAMPLAPSAPNAAPSQSDSTLRGVIVVGTGTEREFVDQAVTEVMNDLSSKGVEVSRAPAGVDSTAELLKQSGGSATSVLVLTLRFGYLENLRAHCYGPNGRQLWEEKAAGSMGFTKAGITQGLIDRIVKKLDSHVGSECLPKRK